jgi:hypothetical protein
VKALHARLKDLAQNFEEATVDKKEQEEKVVKMKEQLKTASELNAVIWILYTFIIEKIFFHAFM